MNEENGVRLVVKTAPLTSSPFSLEFTMDFREYFAKDQHVCGGELVVRGTRIPVRTILASLAEGSTAEEILDDFPSLKHEQIQAVIMFAAEAASDDFPTPPVPDVA